MKFHFRTDAPKLQGAAPSAVAELLVRHTLGSGTKDKRLSWWSRRPPKNAKPARVGRRHGRACSAPHAISISTCGTQKSEKHSVSPTCLRIHSPAAVFAVPITSISPSDRCSNGNNSFRDLHLAHGEVGVSQYLRSTSRHMGVYIHLCIYIPK